MIIIKCIFFSITCLDYVCFSFKFTTKQLERLAKKAEKEEKIQQGKVKKVTCRLSPC